MTPEFIYEKIVKAIEEVDGIIDVVHISENLYDAIHLGYIDADGYLKDVYVPVNRWVNSHNLISIHVAVAKILEFKAEWTLETILD